MKYRISKAEIDFKKSQLLKEGFVKINSYETPTGTVFVYQKGNLRITLSYTANGWLTVV